MWLRNACHVGCLTLSSYYGNTQLNESPLTPRSRQEWEWRKPRSITLYTRQKETEKVLCVSKKKLPCSLRNGNALLFQHEAFFVLAWPGKMGFLSKFQCGKKSWEKRFAMTFTTLAFFCIAGCSFQVHEGSTRTNKRVKRDWFLLKHHDCSSCGLCVPSSIVSIKLWAVDCALWLVSGQADPA